MKQSNYFLLKPKVCILILMLCAFQYSIYAQGTKGFKGYGIASCNDFSENTFIKNWLILGPIGINTHQQNPVDDAALKLAFDKDVFTSVSVDRNKSIEPITYEGKQYKWKSYSSENNIISLNKFLGDTNNVLCYALSEIISPEAGKVLIGLGSDDGVKVWVNGKEVHKNKIGRGVTIDNDLFEIFLLKGSNQVLIKIQNERLGYGFSFRPLGNDLISDQVIENSGSGNFDNVKMLMNYKPDLKKVNEVGLTAWQWATISGRNEIAQFLEKNGAEKVTEFPSLTDIADRALSPFNEKNNTPGIAVLIARDGNIIYKKGVGNANVETNLLVGTDTKFRIGSITKQFTAAAILRLQEEGKINVNDKLSTYLPEFPRGNEVTIYQLLTHTSGIHSYTNRSDFYGKSTKPVSESELLKIIEADTFDFNPGERLSYCNSGYFILGYIVSVISGKTYSEYLSEVFFKPLGMNNTGVYSNAKSPENEAIGYTFENGNLVKAQNWDMTWAGGAGAIYSTVEDLFIWNETVFNGKVLNDNSLKMAFTKAVLNNGEPAREMAYGFGWMLADYRGLNFISHGGGLDGFLSFLLRQPDEKLTIAVLTNSAPAHKGFDPTSVSYALAEYILWRKMSSQVIWSVDTSLTVNQLRVFTGRYDYGHGMILSVTLDGEHLMAQLAGQPAFEIFYMGNNEFYWKVVEARIKFTLNEQGMVTGATHFQGGQQLSVLKIQEQAE